MTDKTDIAALRIKSANVIGLLTAESLTGSFALDSLADVFDDMFRLLEAERHKGDLWFGKVADLEAALKAERQQADKNGKMLERVAGQRDKAFADIEKAEAELAALKGDQVPVAWQSVSTSSCNRMVTLHKEMADDWERKGFTVIPLVTAQQKLVVSDSMALAFHQALNDGGIGHSDLEEIKVGLRAALGVYDGGIVKDGELVPDNVAMAMWDAGYRKME